MRVNTQLLYNVKNRLKRGKRLMESIKNILIGIAIILLTILIHLFLNDGYVTDFIGVIGVILVIVGYYSKD